MKTLIEWVVNVKPYLEIIVLLIQHWISIDLNLYLQYHDFYDPWLRAIIVNLINSTTIRMCLFVLFLYVQIALNLFGHQILHQLKIKHASELMFLKVKIVVCSLHNSTTFKKMCEAIIYAICRFRTSNMRRC